MEYRIRFFRISIRYLTITRLDLHDLLDILRSLGYRITATIPPKAFRATIGGRGPIAQKGETIIDVDTDRLVIGVSSTNPKIAFEEFSIIEKTLDNYSEILRDRFYEVLMELEIRNKEVDMMELMKQFSVNDHPLLKKFSETLNEQLYIYGYRFVKQGTSPEGLEWIDIEVIPLPRKPHTTMYIAITFRTRNKKKLLEVIEKIQRLPSVLSEFLK